ncbi:MAG: hypothetical protein KDC67_02405 [Ignavibacteriae bacterium]|nr:hypothetical protein [Ignavibacteriota bacterium]
MNRKLVSTMLLAAIFVVIAIAGSAYTYYFQGNEIEANEKQLKELKINAQNTEELEFQLTDLKKKIVEMDSILSLRKYIIPTHVAQSGFFQFVTDVSSGFSQNSHVDVEYVGNSEEGSFSKYTYQLKGTAEFNDLFKLVYSIEQSKELKKVTKGNLTNFVEVDDDGFPHYLVNYTLEAQTYYSSNDMFASLNYSENKLNANPLYNIFYPLIRDEIPPNTDNLIDVQTAQLLALIPDGAYVSDASGNTHLLWEGDQVYLGYLTRIDYTTSEVEFILNKGGIIEKVNLKLEKKKNENDKKLTSK